MVPAESRTRHTPTIRRTGIKSYNGRQSAPIIRDGRDKPAITNRIRHEFLPLIPERALTHADQREVDEPRLRRNEALNPLAHRPGIEVVHDVEHGRIVYQAFMGGAV